MKGKKNNRRKIFIFLIMILVGFVYLHFNGFSYPGNINISQAYSLKEGADGRRYLLDEGHELALILYGIDAQATQRPDTVTTITVDQASIHAMVPIVR